MWKSLLKFRQTQWWRYSLDLHKIDWEVDIIFSWLNLEFINVERLEEYLNTWFLEYLQDEYSPADFEQIINKKTKNRDSMIKEVFQKCLDEYWLNKDYPFKDADNDWLDL